MTKMMNVPVENERNDKLFFVVALKGDVADCDARETLDLHHYHDSQPDDIGHFGQQLSRSPSARNSHIIIQFLTKFS